MEKKLLPSQLYSHPGKLLEDHLISTQKLIVHYLNEMPDDLADSDLGKTAKIVGLTHDLGKATDFFQKHLKGERVPKKLSRHSLFSALITYHILKEQFQNNEMPMLGYMTVLRHHGDLENPETEAYLEDEEIDLVKKQIDNIDQEKWSILIDNLYKYGLSTIPTLQNLKNWVHSFPALMKEERRKWRKMNNLKIYFFANLLFSLLIDGDKTEVVIKSSLPSRNQTIPFSTIQKYRERFHIHEASALNQMRERAFQEAININQSIENPLFSLNLPTGMGKTIAALAFAFKLREKIHQQSGLLPRIIYALPFLSIIDQCAEVIEEILSFEFPEVDSSLFLKHHHLSGISYIKPDEYFEPEEAKILIEGWNAEIVLTTFVQIFHTLIGYRNQSLRKFHRLCPSIIILDEVQSIPVKYWGAVNMVLKDWCNLSHSYVLLVTATEPLLFESSQLTPLVEKNHYFKNLDRVRIYIHKQESTLEEFVENLPKGIRGRILFVFNTISSARQAHQLLEKHYQKSIEFLSSHVVPQQRLERIKAIRNGESSVVVSTQLIEAGVDIDFDIVYRDFAPLDSLNQTAGRCNRNNLNNKGEMHLIFLLNEKNKLYANSIYDRILLGATREVLASQDFIEEKNFLDLVDIYYRTINERKSKKESESYLNALSGLRYQLAADNEKSIKDFELIEEDFPRFDVFIELNEEAKKLWETYLSLKEIGEVYKRRLEFQKIKNRFYHYVIAVPFTVQNQPPVVYGFGYISQLSLDSFYDSKTGYKIQGDIILW